jgi:hypothetical protein
MTPATSVFFAASEFNDFLYALVREERNEMPLSVLSALARLNVDPWKEAAELSELPADTATRRLASLIARLPGERWAQTDSRAIADRLIQLLPDRGSSKVSSAEKAHGRREIIGSAVAIMLICAAVGVTALIIAANREPSPRGNHADVPHFNRASPPQTQ